MESETIMVDQDPPIDPSVEPSLPVSTHVGTGMLTSTPQLSDTPVLGSGPTTEILPVQENQVCLVTRLSMADEISCMFRQ